MDDIVAYEPGYELKNSFQDVRPAAHNIRDYVANVIADILAPAIASEDSAEEIANAAYHPADRAANGLYYRVTYPLQNLSDNGDKLLDELAELK